jgi:hypothetical protein
LATASTASLAPPVNSFVIGFPIINYHTLRTLDYQWSIERYRFSRH